MASDSLFSPEIEELEQFIDSYAREHDDRESEEIQGHQIEYSSAQNEIHAELFNNSANEYNFPSDFQQELNEYQKKQNMHEAQMQNFPGIPQLNSWDPQAQYMMQNYQNMNMISQMQPQQNPPVTNPYYVYPSELTQTPNYQNIQFPVDPTLNDMNFLPPLHPSQHALDPMMFPPFSGGMLPEWVDTSKPPPPLPQDFNTYNPHLYSPPEDHVKDNTHNPTNAGKSQRTHSTSSNPSPQQKSSSNPTQNGFSNGKDRKPKSPKYDSTKNSPQSKGSSPRQQTNSPRDNGNRRRSSSNKSEDGLTYNKKSGGSNTSPRHTSQQQQKYKGNNTKPRPSSGRRRENEEHPRSVQVDGAEIHCTKVVSGKSKAAVRNWLGRDEAPNRANEVERKMKNLEISQPKDLSRFIKMAQNYINTEPKLKEVAEILCNKALKNPGFAKNCAILCNEMSNTMIQGTKFRSVVLNLVQGHFQNRESLISASIRNNRDITWVGFIAFLSELYLKLRTATDERLNALVKPIYDCLFLMLKEENMVPKVTKCFYFTLYNVGYALEKSLDKIMAELISQLRDKVVSPVDLAVDSRRHLLHSLELYARRWNTFPPDRAYYERKNS